MQNVEIHSRDNLQRSLLSIQMLIAVAGMLFFWKTIVPFDSEKVQNNKTVTDWHDVPDIIEKAEALRPMVLIKNGKNAEAMTAANAMLKAQCRRDALANICVGDVFLANNVINDGFKCLKNGVALSRRNNFALRHYAQKLAQFGKTDDAIVQYQLILRQNPAWDIAHQELAQLYLLTKNNVGAASEFKIVCDIDPKNFSARKLQGIALGKAGDLHSGLAEYVMATAQENQNGIPDMLRPLLGPNGNRAIQRAVYELQQQINQRPEDYLPKLRLAQLYCYMNDPKSAKDLLVEARRIASSNPEVHRTMAVVLKQLGDQNAALSSFGLSIKLENPHNDKQ